METKEWRVHDLEQPHSDPHEERIELQMNAYFKEHCC
jgi:hypothetical protein